MALQKIKSHTVYELIKSVETEKFISLKITYYIDKWLSRDMGG
jgi:hypothetical protein